MFDFPGEVSGILEALVPGIKEALGDNLVGVYLRGSLVLGDFDPDVSDIDFLAVTDRPVSDEDYASLAAFHERLARLPNRYARDIEGTYVHRAAARCFEPGEEHPSIFRGETFGRRKHRDNWVLERWAVREHGITLFGPDPKTLIDPIPADDLRAAVRSELGAWAEWAGNPDDPDWRSHRGHKAYVVETMCRALCTLATGELPTKPRAVAWARRNLPEPWRTTVERSRSWRNDPTIDLTIVPEVRSFVLWATAHR